jgi:hypothetical protein
VVRRENEADGADGDAVSAIILTPDQLHVLQHSLGVDKHGRGEHYRNRYVCDAGNPVIGSLVASGLMEDWGAKSIASGMHWYVVTDDGKRAMFAQSPPPPKLTRSQQRWKRFVESGALDCGWSFPEWLKTEEGRK